MEHTGHATVKTAAQVYAESFTHPEVMLCTRYSLHWCITCQRLIEGYKSQRRQVVNFTYPEVPRTPLYSDNPGHARVYVESSGQFNELLVVHYHELDEKCDDDDAAACPIMNPGELNHLAEISTAWQAGRRPLCPFDD